MKKSQARELVYRTNQAIKDADDYDTVVKVHTISASGQQIVCEEVRSGHIKINGTEQFSDYQSMVECLSDGAKIETKNV